MLKLSFGITNRKKNPWQESYFFYVFARSPVTDWRQRGKNRELTDCRQRGS